MFNNPGKIVQEYSSMCNKSKYEKDNDSCQLCHHMMTPSVTSLMSYF